MQPSKATLSYNKAVAAPERDFAKQCWAEGLRADRRQANQLRECTVEFPFANDRNKCLVSLGATVVCATVAVELVEPSPYAPRQGFLDVAVHAADAVPASAKAPTGIEVRTMLEAFLKKGGAVDTEGLCVQAGRSVWSVSLTVTILSDEGNVVDAALYAAVTALRHSRRCDVTILSERVVVHSAAERDPVPLSMHHVPIPISAAILPDQNAFVLDPTNAEAGAAGCLVTVGLTPSGQVCAVHKRSGAPCSYEAIHAVLAVAKEAVCGVDDVVVKAMAADEARRKELQRAQFEWAQKRQGIQKGSQNVPAAAKLS